MKHREPREVDGWKLNSQIKVGLKLLFVYTRGNDIKVVDRKSGDTKYTGVASDLVVRENYRRMIAKLKEVGI